MRRLSWARRISTTPQATEPVERVNGVIADVLTPAQLRSFADDYGADRQAADSFPIARLSRPKVGPKPQPGPKVGPKPQPNFQVGRWLVAMTAGPWLGRVGLGRRAGPLASNCVPSFRQQPPSG